MHSFKESRPLIEAKQQMPQTIFKNPIKYRACIVCVLRTSAAKCLNSDLWMGYNSNASCLWVHPLNGQKIHYFKILVSLTTVHICVWSNRSSCSVEDTAATCVGEKHKTFLGTADAEVHDKHTTQNTTQTVQHKHDYTETNPADWVTTRGKWMNKMCPWVFRAAIWAPNKR